MLLPWLCVFALGVASVPVQACTGGACVSAGPRLASIDSTRGVLLNALLGGLAGSSVNLTVADWNGLASGDVSLVKTLAALQTSLGVATPAQALTANATLAQLLGATASAANADGLTGLAAALTNLQTPLGFAPGTIRLGDLITTDGAVGNTRLNALELVTGYIQLYNQRNVLTTPTPILLSGASLGLPGVLNSVQLAAQVVEPPVMVCGGVGTTFHTAAIRVKLNLDLVSLSPDVALLNALPLVSSAAVQISKLDLYVEVARADGIITSIDALANAVGVRATPGLVDLYLGSISDSVFFNRSRALDAATDLGLATIGTVQINGTTVGLRAKSSARGQAPSATNLSFTGPYRQTLTAYTRAAFAANLIDSLVANLVIGLSPSLGGLLDAAVLPVLKGIVQTAITPVLTSVLSGVVDPLLEVLGIRLGEVDVSTSGMHMLCSVAGTVYNDTNHDARQQAGESGTGATLYAKLVASTQPAGPAFAVVVVDPATGAFVFANVPVASYSLVINTASAAANVVAAAPSGWIATEAPSLTRPVTVNADSSGERFGLFRGSKLSGSVFKDNGAGGGVANNGVRDGGELAIAGASLRLTDSGGSTVHDSGQSADNGGFTLWIPFAAGAGPLKLTQVGSSDVVSVSGAAGTTGGTYTRADDTLAFTHLSGSNYTGVAFGDAAANRFDPDGQQTGVAGSTLYFAHTYTAGSAGSLNVSATAPVTPGWATTLHVDLNCNGGLDSGEPALLAPMAVVAEQKVCIIAKVFVPATAPYNSRHPVALTAQLAYANTALVGEQVRNDVVIVGNASEAGLKLIKVVDKAIATAGELITYTITYINDSTSPIGAMKIFDLTPTYTVFSSASCGIPPSAALACSVGTAPAVGATGRIEWTFVGELGSGARGTVSFVVSLQ